MDIYNIIKNICTPSDTIHSKCFGDVRFLEAKNGIITCLLDDNYKVTFNRNGQLCWWSEQLNCWRYDDDSDSQIYLLDNKTC